MVVAQRLRATEESDHFAESQFGPLVEAALEGHFSTEVNDDDAGWNTIQKSRTAGIQYMTCEEPSLPAVPIHWRPTMKSA